MGKSATIKRVKSARAPVGEAVGALFRQTSCYVCGCVFGFLWAKRASVQYYAQSALPFLQRETPGSPELSALRDTGAQGLCAAHGRGGGRQNDFMPRLAGAIRQ